MDETAKRVGARVAHHVVAGALAAAAAVAAPNASAAMDMFLNIDPIKGESKDKTHAGEVDVLAWSWGVSVKGSKVVPNLTCAQQLSLTKYVDKATPPLVTNLVLNAAIPKATLTVRKAGETPLEWLIVTLNNVTVIALSEGGSGGEDRLTENVTLGFSSGAIKYTPQNQDGTGGTPVTAALPASCP